MSSIKHLTGHLVLGIVFWLPIGIAIMVGSLIFGALEPIGKDFLGLFVSDRFLYSGTGIGLWILVMLLTGFLLKLTAFGRFASSIPIVGALFLRMDQNAMTLEKLLHMTPCLFLYSPTCLSYGWILSRQDVKFGDDRAPVYLLNVYYPNVPTLVTGQVYSARKETVMILGNSSREVVDILLYGLRRPETLQYLPWEDETDEEFKQRAERFGLTQTANMSEPYPALESEMAECGAKGAEFDRLLEDELK